MMCFLSYVCILLILQLKSEAWISLDQKVNVELVKCFIHKDHRKNGVVTRASYVGYDQ